MPHSTASGTPTIVDDKTWTTGDFTLVSSDHVRFRVPSYYLLAARWAIINVDLGPDQL